MLTQSNFEQHHAEDFAMALRFLGGDTGDGGSPRLYQDGDEYLVQGYQVTEPRLLAELNLAEGEAAVRVPRALWKYLPPDCASISARGEASDRYPPVAAGGRDAQRRPREGAARTADGSKRDDQ
jgi:hypothetical protein